MGSGGLRVSKSIVTERIAVISDVHGNLTALNAVLAHIRASGIERIVNLGDLVGKGPNSAAVVDRCRETRQTIVQGNWDAEVARATPSFRPGLWHHEQLGPERNAYLASLPGAAPSLTLKFIRLDYDIEAEIALARSMDSPDFEAYARELRTAVYRGRQA